MTATSGCCTEGLITIESLLRAMAEFDLKYAEIPNAMLCSQSLWIKIADRIVDTPLPPMRGLAPYYIDTLYGMRVVVVSDYDAEDLPRLGLDSVLLGDERDIKDLLARYKIVRVKAAATPNPQSTTNTEEIK